MFDYDDQNIRPVNCNRRSTTDVPAAVVAHGVMVAMALLPGRQVRDSVALLHLGPEDFRRRIAELVDIYLLAMHYPSDVAGARSALWEDHSRRSGFDCVIAADQNDRIHGVAYGYHGAPGQWWFSEVRRGARSGAQDELADFFELTELHVHPDRQGRGLGEALLHALAAGRTERFMLLSTPEGENRAWRLYRRLGFRDVLRDFRFTGDPRPFGVLARELPLAGSGMDRTSPAAR